MSIPGHHNDVVLVGDVRDVYTEGDGLVLGVILLVDAGEPCEVPIMFPAPRSGVSVGDRLWARGRLAFEPMLPSQAPLLFVEAQWIDPVKHAGGTS